MTATKVAQEIDQAPLAQVCSLLPSSDFLLWPVVLSRNNTPSFHPDSTSLLQ